MLYFIALLHILIILPAVVYIIYDLQREKENQGNLDEISKNLIYLLGFMAVWGAMYHTRIIYLISAYK
jgi:hypothetical protein